MSESNKTEPRTGVAVLDELFQAVNRSDAPGLVVGVAQNGKTLYRRGFGLASIEHAVANTPKTRMRIGSTSKHFTCLAALLLAEDGKLDIDAGVRTWLPELPAFKAEPTLRQLMTHTSGYRCSLDLNILAHGLTVIPKGGDLALLKRQTGVNFAPGDNIIYSNGGYHLLSLAVMRASGQPLGTFLQQRIFEPLGMLDTALVPSDFQITPGLATTHVPVPPALGAGWRRGMFPTEEVLGEGAVVSTVDDMLRWLAHLRAPGKVVGSASSWALMLEPVRLNNGQAMPYSLGLTSHGYRGVKVVHHAGGVVGGSCQMLTVPSHALDIIVITNGALVDPVDTAYKIVEALLPGDMREVPAIAQSERFKALLGARYHAPASGCVIGFSDLGGVLGLSLMNGPAVPLRDEGANLHLSFEDVSAGGLTMAVAALAGTEAPDSLVVLEAGTPSRFEKLPAVAPALAGVGAAVAGRYRAEDLGADAAFRVEGGQLKMHIVSGYGRSSATLEAFSPEVFGCQFDDPALPLRAVLTLERQDGQRVSGLHLNTQRSRKVYFERRGD